MAKSGRNWFAFFPCIARLFACASVPAADTPANVEGTWKISVSGEAGSAEQIILLKQDGGKITGTFKGPRQSGPLEGTVDGNKKERLTETLMKGTMSGRGKTEDWTATRAKGSLWTSLAVGPMESAQTWPVMSTCSAE